MIDGIIYKIEIGEDFYIGSTETTLKIRQISHNRDLKKHNYKLYETCKANDINDITLIEIKKVKVENKLELRILEQEYINKLQPSLNIRRAYTTEEEEKLYNKEYDKNRYLNNKEKMKEQTRIYRENNKEKVKEIKKKCYEKNKEKYNKKVFCELCEKEMSKVYLPRHKKKYCENKI